MSWLDVGWHFDLVVLAVATPVGVWLCWGRTARKKLARERRDERRARRLQMQREYEQGRQLFLEATRNRRHLHLVPDERKTNDLS